jgi:hypothetical protein
MILLVVLLSQVVSPASTKKPKEYAPPAIARCVQDSFGNWSCSDGSRMICDSFGLVDGDSWAAVAVSVTVDDACLVGVQ